jgi:hypothetical protein
MSRPVRYCSLWLCFFCFIVGEPSLVPAAPPAPPGRHALLIGCTRYDHLPPQYWLEGVPNDVPLLTGVLKDLYGFTDADVRELSEAAAERKMDIAWRPTRKNIEREIAELAKRVGPDHQVVLWLSGHGHVQAGPNPPGAPPREQRQVFLPCDIDGWDFHDTTGKPVQGAVVDFEMRTWLKALTDRGAFVWVIVDACHSGTLCRSGPQERTKELPSALPRKAAAGLELAANNDRLIALYACEPQETTSENRLPGKDDPWHGLLTYTLCQELRQARTTLTYRELWRNLRLRYEADGRYHPRPLVEFAGQKRLVLGQAPAERGPFLLEKKSGGWRIDGGELHGLTAGSILEVRPPAGMGDIPLGHVQVAAVKTLAATVRPCTPDGKPAPEVEARLPSSGGRCKVVFVDYGPLRLRVAVVAAARVRPDLPADRRDAERARLADSLKEMTGRVREIEQQLADQKEAAFGLLDDPARAQWLVCVAEEGVFLLRGGGLADSVVGRAAPEWLLRGAAGTTGWLTEEPGGRQRFALPAGDKLAGGLGEMLDRIARAELLSQVAAASQTMPAPADTDPEETSLLVDVSFYRKAARPGEKDVEIDPERAPPARGEQVVCRIKNLSAKARVAVTVLHVDSDFRITALYPPEGGIRTLLARNQRLPDLPVPVARGGRPGREHLVVLAIVPPEREIPDFTWLAQPDLKGERGLRGAGAAAGKSPLGQLFQRALFRQGGTRGMTATSQSDHLVLLRSWEPRR